VTPLVSILIPCHNAARWLAATLESALAQTHPRCEVILIDDGSTDGSLALAQTFAPRGVRIASQPNRGAAAARNHALRLARGDFIQYLDADDLISPRKIGLQLPLLATRPANTLATCRWGRFETDPSAARFVDEAVFRDFDGPDFLQLAGETGAMMHPSAWLVPRAVADAAGLWDEALSLNDDGEYFCRVVLASAGLAFCADPDARSFYRSGLPGSLSRWRSPAARRSQFRSIELITARLGAADDSPRTCRACAGYWRRFVHDFYPEPAGLIRRAEAEIARLGEETGRPPMGAKTALLAALLGGRTAWRLRHLLRK